MLIDKGVTEGEVITLKLTSGEEIVAKLVEDGAAYYKLKNLFKRTLKHLCNNYSKYFEAKTLNSSTHLG